MSQSVVGLSSRTRDILNYLLRLEGPVSVHKVASALGLSPAQVRYCCRSLELWLHVRGLELIKKPRVGIKVEGSVARKKALLNELQELEGHELALAPGERRPLLLLQTLTAHGPLPLSELQERMGISRTSLFRDLTAAREWLEGRGLELGTHRGRGVQVTGAEVLWREAVLELLLSNLSQGVLVATCVASDQRSIEQHATGHPFFRKARDFLDRMDLVHAERLVVSLENRLQVLFVDEARIRLILCLSLVLFRVSREKLIVDDKELSDCPPTFQDMDAVYGIANEITLATGRDMPAGEIRYLSAKTADALEIGFVTRAEPTVVAGQDPETTEIFAFKLATALAREAAKYLHAGLLHDQELIDCLALEISTLPSRSRWSTTPSLANSAPGDGNDVADPLYGFTHRILSPVLTSRGYACNDRLLSSIAMHVGTALERLGRTQPCRKVWVICGAGVATARNLVSRLNLHLPELEILGIASAFELARNPQLVSNADAIISTIPLDWVTDIQLVQVSPLLAPGDVRMLRHELELYGYEAGSIVRPVPEDGLSMADILPLEAIDTDVALDTWEQVVDHAGALLLSTGAIWPSYVEAMKDMIRLYGPYVVIAPGAALLHAGPEMGTKRLSMSMVVLLHPVPFGHEFHDPVRLALACSSIDYGTHIRAVGEAIDLLRDEGRRKAIIAASSREEILASVKCMVK